MKELKQIVYRFKGDKKSDEVETDLGGNVEVPKPGTTIRRKNKAMKVVHVLRETNISGQRTLPVYTVFLTDRP
jgi:hypothetical protein